MLNQQAEQAAVAANEAAANEAAAKAAAEANTTDKDQDKDGHGDEFVAYEDKITELFIAQCILFVIGGLFCCFGLFRTL